jgi:hypothetical protein
MIRSLIIIALVFLSCDHLCSDRKAPEAHSLVKSTKRAPAGGPRLVDETVEFLWWENRYDEELKDTFNSIVINEDYCKTISDPERAVIGFAATFVGNECWWDGEAKGDRSNLKCKILAALNLGYQCSDQHLGFLRHWFRNDRKSLKELESCPTTPYTSTIQNTFERITLTVKGNRITLYFEAVGVNVREDKSWRWSETDYFVARRGSVRFIRKKITEKP